MNYPQCGVKSENAEESVLTVDDIFTIYSGISEPILVSVFQFIDLPG